MRAVNLTKYPYNGYVPVEADCRVYTAHAFSVAIIGSPQTAVMVSETRE